MSNRQMQVVDLDRLAIENEHTLRKQQLDLSAELSALASGDVWAHTAFVSARTKNLLAAAVAQGMIPGVGVGSEISWDGRAASEVVWGAPVTLANGRSVPFFCGVQRLRGGVRAEFSIRNGRVYLDYEE